MAIAQKEVDLHQRRGRDVFAKWLQERLGVQNSHAQPLKYPHPKTQGLIPSLAGPWI